MPEGHTTFQQAVFTSVRTPMGEGYRIVAASPGLRREEKQRITQSSPSHNALSDARDSGGTAPDVGRTPSAAAFYALPTGRLCVAISFAAGAEHTGRGGNRVYTHCLVMEEADLAEWHYNPFNILRAMTAHGLTVPQLKPPAVLEELRLAHNDTTAALDGQPVDALLVRESGPCALQMLLNDRRVILNLPDGWMGTAEALLLGVPAPTRCRLSFSVGLNYSATRDHQLTLLQTATDQLKRRVAGQPITCVDATSRFDETAPDSPWLVFVHRHWKEGRIGVLAARTARGLDDPGPDGRNSLGRLYNNLDAIPETDTPALLDLVKAHLDRPPDDPYADVVTELLDRARAELLRRFTDPSAANLSEHWQGLVILWRSSDRAGLFAFPVVDAALRAVAQAQPIEAAPKALDIAAAHPPDGIRHDWSDLLDGFLRQLVAWLERQSEQPEPVEQAEALTAVSERFRARLPDSDAAEQLAEACENLREREPARR